MMRPIFLTLFIALSLTVVAAGQKGERVEVPAGAVSFVRPAFLVQHAKNREMFVAPAERFGVPAFLMFSSPILLKDLKTKRDLDDFELILKSDKYQKDLANGYLEGLGETGTAFKVDKVEYTSLVKRPTVKISVSGKIKDVDVRSVAFVIYSRAMKKMYYVVWMGAERSFDDLAKALGPVVDSIVLK